LGNHTTCPCFQLTRIEVLLIEINLLHSNDPVEVLIELSELSSRFGLHDRFKEVILAVATPHYGPCHERQGNPIPSREWYEPHGGSSYKKA